MLKKIFIPTLLLLFTSSFFQHLFAQHEKVGKIVVVKYNNSSNKLIESTTDSQIAQLNKMNHNVLIANKQDSILLKTDSLGLFKIPKKYFDYCKIVINQDSKNLKKEFLFLEGLGKKDSLLIELDDYKISNQIDSIKAPEFYKTYNLEKAEHDFATGKKRYLVSLSTHYADGITDNLCKKSLDLGCTIEYPEKMSGTLTERRIIYRYNKRMNELLEIKEER